MAGQGHVTPSMLAASSSGDSAGAEPSLCDHGCGLGYCPPGQKAVVNDHFQAISEMCAFCSLVSVPKWALLGDLIALCVTLRDVAQLKSPALTFLPKCKSFSQLPMFLKKENATFKGSTRCFQKHLRCKKGQASFSLPPADPE